MAPGREGGRIHPAGSVPQPSPPTLALGARYRRMRLPVSLGSSGLTSLLGNPMKRVKGSPTSSRRGRCWAGLDKGTSLYFSLGALRPSLRPLLSCPSSKPGSLLTCIVIKIHFNYKEPAKEK